MTEWTAERDIVQRRWKTVGLESLPRARHGGRHGINFWWTKDEEHQARALAAVLTEEHITIAQAPAFVAAWKQQQAEA